jgi:hypothetical protein
MGRSPTRQGMVYWSGELHFVWYSVSQNALFIMYNHGQSAFQNSSFISISIDSVHRRAQT